MAKKEELTPEEAEKKRREQERKEKEAKERAELEKKKKEKEEKRKRIEKRQKKKQKEEMKRIKSIIDFPFKTLFHVSSLITLLYFIVVFFGSDKLLYKAIYNSFIVFTSLYLGLGIVIVAIFLVISEKKEKEFQEELRIMMEKRKEEEERRLQDMKDIEAEIKSSSRSLKRASVNEEEIDLERQIESQMSFSELPSSNEHYDDLGELELSEDDSDIFDNPLKFNDEDDYESILSDKK